MSTSVVIPCHNEAASIDSVITAVPSVIDEIIVVDNNSTDETARIAQSMNAVVVPEQKKGYGHAIRAGLAQATGDVQVVLDGDGQYPAEKIADIVEYLHVNDCDFISCSRLPLQNKAAMPRVRQVGNWGLTTATNLMFFTKLKDSQSGMWAFRKWVVPKILPNQGDMPFSQEFKLRAALHPEIVFVEYPIGYEPRQGSSKLVPMTHGVKNLSHLVSLRLKNPLLWRRKLS